MENQNQIQLYSLDNMKQMAMTMVNSKLFGIQNADQALALMLIAQAHGKHPALIAEDYDIIQGKPALKSHAMLSRFQEAGGTVKWIERTETACEAEFTHKSSGSLKVRWTLEMAQKAGLATKDNYRKHPRQMLAARVVSEGVKASFPGCTGPAYTPEEVTEFEPKKEPENIAHEVVIETNTEEIEAQKRWRQWRGKLNQKLLKLKTLAEMEDAYKSFETVIGAGEGVWTQKTFHNDKETFGSLYDEHLARIENDIALNGPKGIAIWMAGLDKVTTQDGLASFVKSFREKDKFNTIDCEQALQDKATELGMGNYTECEPAINDAH